ncbi:MAG: DUF4147 domain-containing protein [Candidatus Promineifilaceae bacterium]|nr:DUF4147 domain-containing protein [Candidatus Promineifilaceae bacterium]
MLNYQDYRRDVDQLVRAALEGADPANAVEQNLYRDGNTLRAGDFEYQLDQGRVYLLSVGKAAISMAQPAIEILADQLQSALVISKKGGPTAESIGYHDHPHVLLMEGNHPISGPDSINATRAASDMMAQAAEGDLLLCLISGGTSALLTQPAIALPEWQQLNRALLASGCTINEFNLVRRNLDRVKGGGLVQMAAPATCVSLILSDVVGNPLPDIGSGPTVYSEESAADALIVLERYRIEDVLPAEVWQHIHENLQQRASGMQPEAGLSTNIIVADVRQAATTALTKAMQLGFVTQLLTAHLEGEAREVGRVAAAIAKDLLPGRCLILGGETTVTLQGDGSGGRNQELALAAAHALDGTPAAVIASIATDGEDGPTPAAGAVVSGETAAIGRLLGLDTGAYLARNDSFHYFQALDELASEPGVFEQENLTGYGTLIKTGSTGTNVNDLLFILSYPHISHDNTP